MWKVVSPHPSLGWVTRAVCQAADDFPLFSDKRTSSQSGGMSQNAPAMERRGASKRQYRWPSSNLRKIFYGDKPLIETLFEKGKDIPEPKAAARQKNKGAKQCLKIEHCCAPP
jgi:hypothetical protein